MFVKAAPERTLPMEQDFRRYIKADTVVQVESTAYYNRAISGGDLIEVDQKEWDAQETSRIALEEAAIKSAEADMKAKAKAEKTATTNNQ
jgi:hypothetical protein